MTGRTHQIRSGDCIHSLSMAAGLFWETVWNHGENAELKQERDAPEHLRPGDLLFLPEITLGEESVSSEARHRFRRKGVPAMLRMAFADEDGPRADERYVLVVDGTIIEGTLDGEGSLEASMPPGAKGATIRIGEDEEETSILLGGVDPIDTVEGVQQRLDSLGFACGEADGVVGPKTKGALKKFQEAQGMEPTGELDDSTQSALEGEYGC